VKRVHCDLRLGGGAEDQVDHHVGSRAELRKIAAIAQNVLGGEIVL